MSQLTISRTPDVIATEINSIKGQTRQVILYSSVEIGRRLAEAKSLLSHGEWGTWLKDHVDYSQSTANNLMQIYREYGSDVAKFPALANLSYTKALALIGIPEEEREQFVQDNDVEGLSAKELQQVVKEKQQLEQQLKRSEETVRQMTEKYAELEYASKAHDDLVRQLTAQIEEAKLSGDDDEARRMQEELTTSQARVQELETELQQRPIDVPGIVEKVPESIEAELADLRRKVAQPNGQEAIRFRFCFDDTVRSFQDLLSALEGVRDADPEAHVKYRTAVSGLIEKMSERL